MKRLKINNTYKFNLKGLPKSSIDSISESDTFIVNPNRLKDNKFKLLIKENDRVSIGSELVVDKKQPHLKILSPVGGVVKEIVFGHRRSIERIIIKKDDKETVKTLFDPVTHQTLDDMDTPSIVERLINGGVWTSIIKYPFEFPPLQQDIPPAIYVSVDYDEPFMPDSSVFLNEYFDDFIFGLNILNKITDKVFVGVSENNAFLKTKLKSVATHILEGDYPANNPGVFLYYNKKKQDDNSSWGVRSLDVIRFGQLFKTGTYPIQKLITLAGPLVKSPRYLKIREGVSLDFLSKETLNSEPYRIICGGL